jgi:flagellar biogenesis protein FliO
LSARPAIIASVVPDGGVFEILFIAIVFFCIIFLAYAVTRIVAKRAAGRMKSRHMEVVDNLAVGADSQLLIVKAGEEIFLAAKSQKQLPLLTKLQLTPEEIAEAAAGSPGLAASFRRILESKLGRPGGGQAGGGGAGVFRDNIDRIKGFSDAPNKDKERTNIV